MTAKLATRLVVVLVATLAGCAHVEAPSGGPDMRTPLGLTAVQPDSLEVVAPFRGPVVFTFQRRLSEQGLRDAVLVSPETSPVVVSHSGRELRIRLRNGWEPGHVYHVTVLPSFQDLWANRPEGQSSIVFSTGPEIPDTRVAGEAIDRITGRPEIGIRVEAIRQADSLVYATRTDSAGGFALDRVPAGDYLVRAYHDLNRNRALDEFEPRDTARLTVAPEDSVSARLRVVTPDTTPPAPQNAQYARGEIEVRFDDHLDPDQPLTTGQVEIVDTTGVVIAVARLAVGRLPATEVEPDTVEAAEPPVVQAPPVVPPGAGDPRPAPTAADTVQGPLPSQSLMIEPDEPLAAGMTYTIRVRDIVNVVGLAGDGEVTLTVPADAAPPAPAPDPAAVPQQVEEQVEVEAEADEEADQEDDEGGPVAGAAAVRQTTYSQRSES